ncbi:glycine zipper 2TM domain-containing protein [Noviherbaspirillum agri]
MSAAMAGALAVILSACGSPTKQQVGIGTGAVVGGVVGNVLTDGSTLGTVGGAAVGGVVGNEVTERRK